MTDARKPTRSRLRLLSEDEIALWVAVASTVVPKPGSRLPVQSRKPLPQGEPASETRGASQSAAEPQPAKVPATLPLAPLERRLKQRLARGRTEVDASVDLHGLRQDEALAVLRGFLHRAHGAHAKVVLVVTGKGRSSRNEDGWSDTGVLRRVVPHWLSGPDLRHIVMGFDQATPNRGGSGALYVRLRSPHRLGAAGKHRP